MLIRKPRSKKFILINLSWLRAEDIEQAIRDRDPDVVFLHKVGPEGTKIECTVL